MNTVTMNDRSTQIDAGEYKGDLLGMKLISADSHITEPPHCYIDYIEPAYRDRAPRIEDMGDGGEAYVIDGFEKKIQLGLAAAAGIKPEAMRFDKTKFADLHLGGWQTKARLIDQDRDGVAAEIVYPSIGMVLCNHPDGDYKAACFKAYNKWLMDEFISGAPDRLYGVGQTAVTSVEQTIKDFRTIKDQGFKGVMMPGFPATEFDYDDPRFDPVWQASIDMELPLSFHILTAAQNNKHAFGVAQRGSKVANGQHSIIREIQDVSAMFIWARIFERFPEFKLVCVEADAGWAPHFMYRLDHFYNRHRHWSKTEEMARMPSEYFRDNIFLTFQDDWSAFEAVAAKSRVSARQLMWANDFPHSDSTWPISRPMLDEQIQPLSQEERNRILRDNCAELYKLDV